MHSNPNLTKLNPQLKFSPHYHHHRHHNHSYKILNPQNTLWTAEEIAYATKGKIVKTGPPGTISIDTRTIKPNQWLFALTGKTYDGHDFVTPEISCCGLIGTRTCPNWDKGFVQIPKDSNFNTIESLTAMARFARRSFFDGTMIAVTGSVGKTTTRSMIALALQTLFPDPSSAIYQTQGSLNNEIGIAMTLIGMPRKGVEFAVVEIGISRRGEMLELARSVGPRVRVLTNVVASHLGNFGGSIEEIAKEKGDLFLDAQIGDVCFLNADDPLVMGVYIPPGVHKVLFGRRKGCDVRLVDAQYTNGGFGVRVVLEKNGSTVEFTIESPGLHLAMNACAAAAVATHFGVSLSEVGASLSTFKPVHMRCEIRVLKNGLKIINDAYNASPVPMKNAIELLSDLECRGKRVIVLGDMIETGSDKVREVRVHEGILKQCCDASGISLVGLFGERFSAAAENMNLAADKKFIVSPDKDSLGGELLKRVNCDDVVLVKGARIMEMEKIVDMLVKANENN